MTSISARPQLGQAMRSSPLRSRRPRASSSWRPARASSTGSAVSEYRMVSPIPSASRVAMPAVPFNSPAGGGPGLGHPEVQRMVEGLRRQPVGLDHERHRRGLDRDLDVVEVDLGEVGQLHPGRLDQGLGGGPAEPLVEIGVQRAGVDPDPDGHAPVLGLGGHLLDLVRLAQVARVEPQALDAGLEGGQRHLVVEVDVGDDRHRATGGRSGPGPRRPPPRCRCSGRGRRRPRPARRSGSAWPRRRPSWWSSSTGP